MSSHKKLGSQWSHHGHIHRPHHIQPNNRHISIWRDKPNSIIEVYLIPFSPKLYCIQANDIPRSHGTKVTIFPDCGVTLYLRVLKHLMDIGLTINNLILLGNIFELLRLHTYIINRLKEWLLSISPNWHLKIMGRSQPCQAVSLSASH